MIKIRLFLPFVMIFLFLSSITYAQEKSNQKMSYAGNGKEWSATYVTTVTNGQAMNNGKIKYTGKEDLSSLGEVTCTFETPAGQMLGKSLLAGAPGFSPAGDKGTATVKASWGYTDLVSKAKKVKVTVKWKEKTETFILKMI